MTKVKELVVQTEAPPAPVVQRTETAAILSMFERVMGDASVPIERVNQAFEFYQKVQADAARRAFDAAMADAKAEIPPILKKRHVSHATKSGDTKSYDHEDLAGIAEVVNPILGKHGLSYRFRTSSNPNEPICVTCIVSHRLGYSEENSLIAGRDDSGNKNSIQSIGSTITYLQRYTLKAALGLAAAHDDDGRAAGAAPEFINADQVAELQELIKTTNTDTVKFLEFAKVEALTDMTVPQFENAKRALQAKLKRAGK